MHISTVHACVYVWNLCTSTVSLRTTADYKHTSHWKLSHRHLGIYLVARVTSLDDVIYHYIILHNRSVLHASCRIRGIRDMRRYTFQHLQSTVLLATTPGCATISNFLSSSFKGHNGYIYLDDTRRSFPSLEQKVNLSAVLFSTP